MGRSRIQSSSSASPSSDCLPSVAVAKEFSVETESTLFCLECALCQVGGGTWAPFLCSVEDVAPSPVVSELSKMGSLGLVVSAESVELELPRR